MSEIETKTIGQLPRLPGPLSGVELLEVERPGEASYQAPVSDLVALLPEGPQGPVGDVTPEALAARDAAQEAATTASTAAGTATGAATAASGSASAAAASANLAEQARLLGATIGFATKADMDASLVHPEGTLALVTSDATAANNGTYRKTGASGSGTWVQSADRVSGLEGRVGTSEHELALIQDGSPNLIDPDDVSMGYTLSTLGTLVANADFWASGFIEVSEETQYVHSLSAANKVHAFYNENLAFLSYGAAPGGFTTPSDAAYVRVSARISEFYPDEYMLVEGASLPAIYAWPRKRDFQRKDERNVPGGYAGLNDAGEIPAAIVEDLDTANLFNPEAAEINAAINSLTGETSANVNFFTTDFIDVEGGEDYAFSPAATNKFVAQYDANKQFLSTISSMGSFTASTSAHFVRISMRYSDVAVERAMVSKSPLPDSFVPYGGAAMIRERQRNKAGGFVGLPASGTLDPVLIPPEASSQILRGKVIAGLGDSITYGFIPRNAPGYPGQLDSWLPLVAEKLGASALNYGISGSTLGANSLGADQPMSRRFSAMSDAADLVIVMGGTNDVRKDVPLGVMGDTADTTYYGALDVLCQGLLQKFRYAQGTTVGAGMKIMFMTPIRLLDIGEPDDLHPTLESYAEAVKEVSARYSIPVFDAYNLSGLTPNLFRTLEGTETGYTDMYNPYVTDGTHPTQEGHRILADAVAGFIRGLY